ncbi:MAG TPA: ATP-binding protein [Ktedonobacterales bacterium]
MWQIGGMRAALRGRTRALVKRARRMPRPAIEYGAAVASVALTTLVIGWVQSALHASNLSIVYLIAVLWLAATFGRWPAVAASVLAFLAYDFFFVPPLHGFTVDAPAEWVSLSALLATALVLGQLTSMVQAGAREARRGERRIATLYALSQLLASTTDAETLPAAIVRRVLDVFGPAGVSACGLILRGPDGRPVLRASVTAQGGDLPGELLLREPRDMAQASWVLDHGAPVGGPIAGETALVGATEQYVYLVPLVSGRTVAGALGIGGAEIVRELAGGLRRRPATTTEAVQGQPSAPRTFSSASDPAVGLFAAFCEQIALALDRLHLQREAIHAEALRESDQLKDAFLGSVSHDFRTPLASITSATTTLLAADMRLDDADRQALLGTIGQSADRLNRLVGNLLDLSRLEAGVAAPQRDWYLIDDAIATVLDRLEVAHELGSRRIELRLCDHAPLVLMDHAQIEQVLTNLLENALKYSPPETPITISTALREVPPELEVTVRDEGIGIPPAEIGAIFDKFYRVTTVRLPWATNRPATGTGLGLAICAGIVEAHGGRIWAESAPGDGATFHFTLPLSPDAPAGALPDVADAGLEAGAHAEAGTHSDALPEGTEAPS